MLAMKIRKVQELEDSGFLDRLLAAKEAVNISVLKICDGASISPAYWYRLIGGKLDTINYDLVQRLEKTLNANLVPKDAFKDCEENKTKN